MYSWRQALEVQKNMFENESRDAAGMDDEYFKSGADALEEAMKIWDKKRPDVDNQIAQLQRKIDAIEKAFHQEVAYLLLTDSRAENGGWRWVAKRIGERGSTKDFLDW